jgi:hypothetical protein
VVLRDAGGDFVARVDLFVDGVVIEFDGQGKYARQRDPEDGSAGPEEVVWLEKRREDAIRSGWVVTCTVCCRQGRGGF